MSRLMVVSIQAESRPAFEAGVPKPLFVSRMRTSVPESNAFAYSVTANGQRFLVNVPESTAEPTLNVIVTWEKAAAVKER